MDRLAATTSRLEALADRGAGAERLAAEIAVTVQAWRSEAEADIRRLRVTLAALGVRHEAERDRAMAQGMAAEGSRQAGIALALKRAAQTQNARPNDAR